MDLLATAAAVRLVEEERALAAGRRREVPLALPLLAPVGGVQVGTVPAGYVLPHIGVYCLALAAGELACGRCGAWRRLGWAPLPPHFGGPAGARRPGWLVCPPCMAAVYPDARVEWRAAG